jgi:hypothetical protein
MWTIEYKGFYIHGYVDSNECYWREHYSNRRCEAVSLHAAKIQITKYLGS